MDARGLGLVVTASCAALLTTLLGGQVATATALEAVPARDEAPQILTPYPEFSPNGDGDHDRLTVGYQLSVGAPVRIRVEPETEVAPFTVAVGHQRAGRHTWTWDGRTPQGRLVPHGYYRIHVITPQGREEAFASADLKFQGSLHVLALYGAKKTAVPKVYPRSVDVRDGVPLGVEGWTDGMRRGVVSFRDADGRVVLRRQVRLRPKWFTELVWEGRDGRGRPLPPGRYSVTFSGTDGLGNRGATEPVRLWVSQDRLEWREETRTMTAEKAKTPPCVGSSWPECWAYLPQGEVTPSVRFPGGLTHRANPDPAVFGRAESNYFVRVPEAVRGLDAIRVAFVGASTDPGETDEGHLSTQAFRADGVVVSSSSTAQTPWDEDPVYGDGQEWDSRSKRLPPGAWWEFWTDGDDAFDVATFTLDLRYLVVDKSS